MLQADEAAGRARGRTLPSCHGRARPVRAEANAAELKEEAERLHGLPALSNATHAVFGEGSAKARLMLVGEQPGDVEDQQGRPFVGPPGQLLDWAIEKAGIDRRRAYVTTVVKHFKWVPRRDADPQQAELDGDPGMPALAGAGAAL